LAKRLNLTLSALVASLPRDLDKSSSKNGTKGGEMRLFRVRNGFSEIRANSFGMNGGDDGTRTRSLCREQTA
jgi:hypothetical protein